MPDRFVNLQHHLFRHQQQIHLAGRAVRRRQQGQRLFRHALAGTEKTCLIENFQPALTAIAVVLAAQAARLCIVAVMGGHCQVRYQITKLLQQVGAIGRQIQLHRSDGADRCIPIDDAFIDLAGARLGDQQLDQFLARRCCHWLANRAGIGTGGTRQCNCRIIGNRTSRAHLGPALRACDRVFQSGCRQVAGRRIAITAAMHDCDHRAAVDRGGQRLQHILPHHEFFCCFIDHAQRTEIDCGCQAFEQGPNGIDQVSPRV